MSNDGVNLNPQNQVPQDPIQTAPVPNPPAGTPVVDKGLCEKTQEFVCSIFSGIWNGIGSGLTYAYDNATATNVGIAGTLVGGTTAGYCYYKGDIKNAKIAGIATLAAAGLTTAYVGYSKFFV